MAGIYLHIPFCKRRCLYCDFYSTTRDEMKHRYTAAICKELELRKSYIDGEPIETIYWGGGTPSQLSREDFEQVFETIHHIYKVSSDAEITIEANPDDLNDEYVSMLRTLPFNRLSMGIQTFNDESLSLLHRRHTAQQAIEAFSRCRDAGFNNISIDLMYGLPNETEQTWANDLEQAIEMRPEHISAYHLIYEEGTPLWKLREQHRVEEADEDLSVRLFTMLIHRLKEAGYQHYEISNFSLPGTAFTPQLQLLGRQKILGMRRIGSLVRRAFATMERSFYRPIHRCHRKRNPRFRDRRTRPGNTLQRFRDNRHTHLLGNVVR